MELTPISQRVLLVYEALARRITGPTKKAFSEVIGISASNWNKYAGGVRPFDLTSVVAVLKTYKVSPNYLLFGEGSMFLPLSPPPTAAQPGPGPSPSSMSPPPAAVEPQQPKPEAMQPARVMQKQTIAQRVVMLVELLGLEVTPFAESLEINPGNIRNYMHRGTSPNSDLIEKIAETYPQVNVVWLITGAGEPLLPESTSPPDTLATCRQDLETARHQLDSFKEQLKLKDQLLEAKEETIALFRSTYNRPN